MTSALTSFDLATRYGWLFFVVSLIGTTAIFLLVQRKSWNVFALSRKWASRVLLFVLLLIVSVSLSQTPGWILNEIPAKLSMASPNLTVTAIKLGLYGRYINHELSSHLPLGGEKLVQCVSALSHFDMYERQNKCGDDRVCSETIPILTRREIVGIIRDSQTKEVPQVSAACKDIDVAKL